MRVNKNIDMEWGRIEFLKDLSHCVGVFLNWILVGLVIDLNQFRSWENAASIYLMCTTLTLNIYRLGQSFATLGVGRPSQTETVLGLWLEIVAQAQGWGLAFAAARQWSLDASDAFFDDPFLHKLGNSIFEMSLVMSGTGWAAAPPYTLAERAVAWATAYIGGVLTINLFLISIIMNRRGWWNG